MHDVIGLVCVHFHICFILSHHKICRFFFHKIPSFSFYFAPLFLFLINNLLLRLFCDNKKNTGVVIIYGNVCTTRMAFLWPDKSIWADKRLENRKKMFLLLQLGKLYQLKPKDFVLSDWVLCVCVCVSMVVSVCVFAWHG